MQDETAQYKRAQRIGKPSVVLEKLYQSSTYHIHRIIPLRAMKIPRSFAFRAGPDKFSPRFFPLFERLTRGYVELGNYLSGQSPPGTFLTRI